METTLQIGTTIFPPLSARGCVQELKLLNAGIIKRTINGEIVQCKNTTKLWTRITCEDKNIPSVLDLEIGQIINIGCIQRLFKNVKNRQKIRLKHKALKQSIFAYDKKGEFLYLLPDDEEIIIPSQAALISYRPWLDMFVTKIEVSIDEWNFTSKWCLEAEEI